MTGRSICIAGAAASFITLAARAQKAAAMPVVGCLRRYMEDQHDMATI
jgi:hypothetical protein